MRIMLAILAMLTCLPCSAAKFHQEIEFSQASELLPWCKTEAEAHFTGKGVETFQWTARHFSRGNVFHVEGKLRAGGKDVAITCRVAKGARERYAVIDIGE